MMTDSDPSKSAGALPSDAYEIWESKSYSKHYDPCQEAADKSIKCMHRNPADKTLCNDYFQAYRDCKKAWQEMLRVEKAKRNKGWF